MLRLIWKSVADERLVQGTNLPGARAIRAESTDRIGRVSGQRSRVHR
jgi:hypothetical protein